MSSFVNTITNKFIENMAMVRRCATHYVISKWPVPRKELRKTLFPTSLCEVLVFGSAPPPLRISASPPLRLVHTQLVHTHLTCPHTQFVHTQLVHTHLVNMQVVTRLVHTQLSTHNLSKYNLSTHNLSTHNLSTHNCLHTTCPHTICPHTLCQHASCHTPTQLVHTQLSHTQLTPGQLTHTQLDNFSYTTYSHTQLDNRHFAWQAWHLAPWTSTLRGRRGTYGTGLALVARLVPSWRRTPPLFAWQAWDLATSSVTLRGRRGTYNAGRHMQQLSPWVSVCLEQQALFHQKGLQLHLVYNYAAYAGVHVLTLHTEGTPLLLFCDPAAVPKPTPWDLCAKGDLGSMESNVMAGCALFALFTVEQKGQRCAIFLLMGKHMQGSCGTRLSKNIPKRIGVTSSLFNG